MNNANATEYLAWAKNEKQRLEQDGRTGGEQYQACLRHLEAAEIIIADEKLANTPRLPRETDVRTWAVRILTPGQIAIRKYRASLK